MRVTGDLGGAEALDLGVHFLACGLGGGDEVNLVALDDPAGQKAGVVRHHLLGGKRLDPPQHLRLNAREAGTSSSSKEWSRAPLLGCQRTFLTWRVLVSPFESR